MAGSRGWINRFLRWFRGDDLDQAFETESVGEVLPELGEAASAPGAVSRAEADAITGVGTALLEGDSLPEGGLFRRHFPDDPGSSTSVPETVDEQYVLAHDPEGEAAKAGATDDDDRLIGDTEGVSLTRTPPDPVETALARVDSGVTQVAAALANVSTAVVQQTEAVERLGKTLSELPATVRAQTVYLETMTRHMEAQSARSAELAGRLKDLPAILNSLPAHLKAQVEFLQTMAATLEGTAGRVTDLSERVGTAVGTLDSLHRTSQAQIRLLTDIEAAQRTAWESLKDALKVNTRRYAWLLFLMWTVTAVTVGGIAFVVYYLTKHLPAG